MTENWPEWFDWTFIVLACLLVAINLALTDWGRAAAWAIVAILANDLRKCRNEHRRP